MNACMERVVIIAKQNWFYFLLYLYKSMPGTNNKNAILKITVELILTGFYWEIADITGSK